jgi:hypothetical protein
LDDGGPALPGILINGRGAKQTDATATTHRPDCMADSATIRASGPGSAHETRSNDRPGWRAVRIALRNGGEKPASFIRLSRAATAP